MMIVSQADQISQSILDQKNTKQVLRYTFKRVSTGSTLHQVHVYALTILPFLLHKPITIASNPT